MRSSIIFLFFFFNDTATTEIYTLSLHDALPILLVEAHVRSLETRAPRRYGRRQPTVKEGGTCPTHQRDRKSTRLNSSHSQISYAVFCLKKKKTKAALVCLWEIM